MDKVVVNSYEDFEKLLGRQIGISDYVEVSQDRINLFADATLDHQWIHVDTERAKVESGGGHWGAEGSGRGRGDPGDESECEKDVF